MNIKAVGVIREFSGLCALVTGSGSGVGRAIALGLARAGAAVVVCDQDLDAAVSVTEEIRKTGNEALPCRSDVRSAADQLAAVALAKAPVADIDPDFWYRMIDTNPTDVFFGLRAPIQGILAAGGGAVVNVASIVGSVGRAGSGAYVAATHRVVGLIGSAALDYAEQSLRLNAVEPAFIRTPLISYLDETPLVAKHPMGRLGSCARSMVDIWRSSDQVPAQLNVSNNA